MLVSDATPPVARPASETQLETVQETPSWVWPEQREEQGLRHREDQQPEPKKVKADSDHAEAIGGEAKDDTTDSISSRLRRREKSWPGQHPEVQREHALGAESILSQSLDLAMDGMSDAFDGALKHGWDSAITQKMSVAIDHLAAAKGEAKKIRNLLVQQGSTQRKKRGIKRKREEGE